MCNKLPRVIQYINYRAGEEMNWVLSHCGSFLSGVEGWGGSVANISEIEN